ncbi:LIM zinc-binding domain-containing protein [Madurella fahalii]|uniref:LIM zinc-binding domain-containing protein n=1 Tax=Madurella fahalii TaxID=1157608 RepID=A0ABQ0GE99_9PEZI
MDPLSITSAVVGLLTATGKVYSLLEGLSSIRNAPTTIRDAQKEVRHAEIALRSIQRLLYRLDTPNPRRGLIQVDELRITLADAMLVTSAFETLLQRLAGQARVRVAISWVTISKQIDEHVARIGRYQQSLMLMMSILQCDSDVEAYQSQEKLQSLIEKVLAQNTELRQKLVESDDSCAAQSIATRHPEDDNATVRLRQNGDASTIRGIGRTHSVRSTISNFGGGLIKFAFENILEQSRVYRKNANQLECDRSFVSSAQRSHAWSAFSGYSLADISVISVIAMPLTTLDIANGKYYLIHTADESLVEPEGGTLAINHFGLEVSPNPPGSESIDGCVTPTNDQPVQPVLSGNILDDVSAEHTLLGRLASAGSGTETVTTTDRVKDDELRRNSVEDRKTVHGPESSSSGSGSTPLPSHSVASENVSNIDDTGSLSETDGLSDEELWLHCKGCGAIIEAGKAFELGGNHWHIDCFRCGICGVQIDNDSDLLLQGDGSLICNNCVYNCSQCRSKIMDLAILVGDEAFCTECFRCRKCKRKIENLRYAMTTRGIFCIRCHEAQSSRRGRLSWPKTKLAPTLEEHNHGPEDVDDAEELSQDAPTRVGHRKSSVR